MSSVVDKIQKMYKMTLSPALTLMFGGGGCIYSPTCSEYAKDALKKYGLMKGVRLAILRVLSCNAYSKRNLNDPA
jgi:putative membrane protein insertion efficiency factor